MKLVTNNNGYSMYVAQDQSKTIEECRLPHLISWSEAAVTQRFCWWISSEDREFPRDMFVSVLEFHWNGDSFEYIPGCHETLISRSFQTRPGQEVVVKGISPEIGDVPQGFVVNARYGDPNQLLIYTCETSIEQARITIPKGQKFPDTQEEVANVILGKLDTFAWRDVPNQVNTSTAPPPTRGDAR